jgi:hypothetical protein
MILFFCIALSLVTIQVGLKTVIVNGIILLSNKSLEINIPSKFFYPDLNQPSLGIFGSLYTSGLEIIQIMPGIFVWIASAILLKRYSGKMGKVMY